MASILEIRRRKVVHSEPAPTFHVDEQEIENPHQFQLFIDYGSQPGPWIRIGYNRKAWSAGYLPDNNKEK